MLLGVLALIVPLWPEFAPEWRIGGLLILAAGIQIFHSFRRSSASSRQAAWFGAAITLAMGLLLMTLPVLASKAMTLLIAVWFAMDGVRYAVRGVRAARGGQRAGWDLAAALGNFGVIGLMALMGGAFCGRWPWPEPCAFSEPPPTFFIPRCIPRKMRGRAWFETSDCPIMPV